jgi:hypothetical protein
MSSVKYLLSPSDTTDAKSASRRKEIVCGDVRGVEVVVETLNNNLCVDSKYAFRHKAERQMKQADTAARLRAKLYEKKAKAGQ